MFDKRCMRPMPGTEFHDLFSDVYRGKIFRTHLLRTHHKTKICIRHKIDFEINLNLCSNAMRFWVKRN